MWKPTWLGVGIAGVLLIGGVSPASAGDAQRVEPQCVEDSQSGSGSTSVQACNCTGDPADVTICHEEDVEVTVGSENIGSFSTGQSTEVCFTQEVEHGECLYIKYVFDCCEGFWGWSCTLKQYRLQKTTTNCED